MAVELIPLGQAADGNEHVLTTDDTIYTHALTIMLEAGGTGPCYLYNNDHMATTLEALAALDAGVPFCYEVSKYPGSLNQQIQLSKYSVSAAAGFIRVIYEKQVP